MHEYATVCGGRQELVQVWCHCRVCVFLYRTEKWQALQWTCCACPWLCCATGGFKSQRSTHRWVLHAKAVRWPRSLDRYTHRQFVSHSGCPICMHTQRRYGGHIARYAMLHAARLTRKMPCCFAAVASAAASARRPGVVRTNDVMSAWQGRAHPVHTHAHAAGMCTAR